ncbi:hypothetical protein BC936DRAFT_147177, partial [Jimgerdemannia flammicorona]
MKPRRT